MPSHGHGILNDIGYTHCLTWINLLFIASYIEVAMDLLLLTPIATSIDVPPRCQWCPLGEFSAD